MASCRPSIPLWRALSAPLPCSRSVLASSKNTKTSLSSMSSRGEGKAIVVQNVFQRFRVIHERPDTVRELFSRFFRKEYNYHDFDAVHDVSFTIPRGEVVGIIGRNGSGKSTLLKMIAGVYRPTRGRVQVAGQVAPLIELGAGMHGELTGRENIVLNGLMMGYSKKQMLEREERILDFAEIGDF